jgi:WD40 repeat protein
MGNQLYTCSKKNLKIWDIENMGCISDIVAHQSVIKSLCVLPEQKLLASACDTVIMLWDLVSLTNVATLKAHQDDIRTLEKGSNILVSAGVSGYNDYSMFVWDLRTSNPIEEREKNSDIQCVKVMENDSQVFVGNTSQLVKSIELRKGPSEALASPHSDIVTCLSKYNGFLVSGSKDTDMKFWNMNTKQFLYTNQNAHSAPITCMD